MNVLMRVDASAGADLSVSRQLGDHFERHWRENRLESRVARFDLSQTPPPLVSAAFIAAAHTAHYHLDAPARAALAYSDRALAELAAAEALLITTPMYNFGLPGALKAWFDQIIRIGVSFGTTDDPARPYVPLLADKPVIVITARGAADMVMGGALAELDHLTRHLRTLLGFIGFSDPIFFDICGTEDPSGMWQRDVERTRAALEQAAGVRKEMGTSLDPIKQTA